MTKLSNQVLFWSPRVLSVAYVAFLSLFALDVFGEHHGFWSTLLALTMHLIPTFVLVAGLILAWRWEWIGATLYACVGMVYLMLVLPRRLPLATKLSWVLTIAAPAFIVAALFLANWFKHGELHSKRP